MLASGRPAPFGDLWRANVAQSHSPGTKRPRAPFANFPHRKSTDPTRSHALRSSVPFAACRSPIARAKRTRWFGTTRLAASVERCFRFRQQAIPDTGRGRAADVPHARAARRITCRQGTERHESHRRPRLLKSVGQCLSKGGDMMKPRAWPLDRRLLRCIQITGRKTKSPAPQRPSANNLGRVCSRLGGARCCAHTSNRMGAVAG